MEKVICIYSGLILMVIFTLWGLLLWEEKKEAGEGVDLKTTLLLICISLIAGLILHLNWMILPWARKQQGELVAFTTFGVLALTFSLLIWGLYKTCVTPEANHSLLKDVETCQEAD